MNLMIKAIFIICLGLMAGYTLSNLPTIKVPPQVPMEIVTENEIILPKYFPIKKGSYWEYKGTRREDTGKKIETSEISKKVEVNTISRDSGIDTLSVTNSGQVEKWVVKDNTIDFDPNELKDKFVLALPLYVGQKWGREDSLRYRDDGYYVWEVERKLSLEVLGKEYDECFRIAYKTVSDLEYKIFCYGIGIVEEGFKHNGTIFEEVYKLSLFK